MNYQLRKYYAQTYNYNEKQWLTVIKIYLCYMKKWSLASILISSHTICLSTLKYNVKIKYIKIISFLIKEKLLSHIYA